MLRIILVRPGSTDYDLQERIQGTLDIPLCSQGLSEVARLVDQLRGKGIEAVYAPACEPAHETAQIVAKDLDVRHKRLDRMLNLDFGLWQGLQVNEVRHKQPKVYRQWQEQPENICPPEGEMLDEAEERVRAAHDQALAAAQGRRDRHGAARAAGQPGPPLHQERRVGRPVEGRCGSHGCWEVLEVEPIKAPVLSSYPLESEPSECHGRSHPGCQ